MKATVTDFLRGRGLFLALLLGLGLLAATIFFTRPLSILGQLISLGPWGFFALLLNFGLSFLCNAKGWGYLLEAQGLRLPFSTVLRIGCASFAFSYLIPSFNLAGEPIRIILATQKLGGEEEKILATVVLEKLLFFGIAVVFLSGAAATVMNQDLPPFLHQGLFSLAGAGAAILGSALVVLLGLPPWAQKGLHKLLPRVSSLVPGVVQGAVWEIRQSFPHRWPELLKGVLAITFGLAFSSHSVTSSVSGQHSSFPSGFPQTLGADGLPMPHPADSKPNTKAFPQPLHYKTLPPPWSASSPP